MNYKAIKLSQRDHIAVLTLARPEVSNALNAQMRAEMLHAVRSMQSSDARVLVITGQGKTFCAGQDLGDQGNAASLDFERTLRDEITPLVRAISDCEIPVIAAVNGAASGSGMNIALAADVVIAAEDAVFTQSLGRIGLMADSGASYWLPRQIGRAKAMGMVLFGEGMTAQEASDMGLIWEVAPTEGFADHWWARATALANGPTQAYLHFKQAMNASWTNDLEAQLTLEAKLQGRTGKTRDFKEGVVAHMERTPAKFEGR